MLKERRKENETKSVELKHIMEVNNERRENRKSLRIAEGRKVDDGVASKMHRLFCGVGLICCAESII
uniref:Uncharacterized protein n=1 Tax=Syphacia muris TaxID=451379 RepID=A0A0N5AIU7_9BILA